MKKFLCIALAVALAACAPIIDSAAEAARGGIKLHGHPIVVTAPVVTSNGGGATATITITTAQTAVTTVTASGTTPITYTKSGADAALFSIGSSTGVLALLTTQAAADYHVTVTATNTVGAGSQNITLTVAPVITPPAITSNGGGSTATVNITTAQTAVTTVTATGSAPITYSIFGGTNAGLFTINSSTGVLALLTTQAVGSYQVIVRASNTGGTANQTITVSVSAPSGTVAFTHVQIGGAGAVQGIASVPSANLLLARTDQYGAYISISNSQWTQLLTIDRMPVGTVTFSSSDGGPIGNGVDAVAADQHTPANIWMGFLGDMYVSTNSGASFSTTCYPTQTAYQNGNQQTKNMDPTIAVDPNNSSIVYMGTMASSLQVTRNQGSTCAAVAGLATPTNVGSAGGGYLIAFDTSGGTLTGASCPSSVTPCTKNIYVSVYGTGVYKSTNAGASWTLTTGTPTTHRYMAVGAGVLWFVDDTYVGGGVGGNAKRFDGAVWTTPSFSGSAIQVSVAVDPNNCASVSVCHVAFLAVGGPSVTAFTTNGGSTWAVASSATTVSSDVPWIAHVVNSLGSQFGGGATFDNSGHVYAGGEGVFWTTPQTSAVAQTFVSQTAGIEEYENNMVVTSPNTSGQVIVSGWDVGCFVLTAPYDTFPATSQQACTHTVPIFWHSYSVDWVAGAPSTFISLADNQTRGSSYASYSAVSTDAGATWTNFSPPTTYATNGYIGGCLAASSSTNWIIAGTDGSGGNIAPYYTANAGASWAQISVAGVTGGWPFTNNGAGGSKSCTADRVTANTFYFYNWNTGSGGDAIVKCTASGATCALGARPGLGPNAQFNPTIKAVPGQANTFFLGVGPVTIGEMLTGNGFFWSTDGGTTLQTIANFTTVSAIGYGAAAPGHTFPTIVVAGYLSHVYGIYQSIDWDGAKTWQKIGDYPLNIPLYIWDIDGDKNVFNIFYYGTNSGIFCSATSTSQCNGGT